MTLAVVSPSKVDIDADGRLSSSDELGDNDGDGKLSLSNDSFHLRQRGKENSNLQKNNHIIYIMLQLLPHIPWPSV